MADDVLARCMAHLKAAVDVKAAHWRERVRTECATVVGAVPALVAQAWPGWTNNNVLKTITTNPQRSQFYAGYLCVAWTAYVIENFIPWREKQRASKLGLGMAHTLPHGGHTFAVIWQYGQATTPTSHGVAIDPWPYQRWHTVPVRDILLGTAPCCFYDKFVVDGNPSLDLGVYYTDDGRRHVLTDARFLSTRYLHAIVDDQTNLYESWCNWKKVQRAGAPFG